MPRVTALKAQKSGKRVNVYLDGKFGFGIDLDNLVMSGIKLEKEFSEGELNEIVKKAEFQKTFDKLLRFVTSRPHSEKEINDWFRRKKVPESLYEGLLGRLSKLDLVNDEHFAKWWIEQRIHFKKKGIRALASELSQKGIERKIIEKVLQETDIDEEKLATALLEKKAKRWNNLDEQSRKKKMSDLLLRNGFGWDLVKSLTGGASEE